MPVEVPVYDLEGRRIMEGSKFPASAREFFLPTPLKPSVVCFTERALVRNTRRFVKINRFANGTTETVFQEQPRSISLVRSMLDA